MESQKLEYLDLSPEGHSSAAQELLKMKRGATGTAVLLLGSGKNKPQRNDCCLLSLGALCTFLSCSGEILSGPAAWQEERRSRRPRRRRDVVMPEPWRGVPC